MAKTLASILARVNSALKNDYRDEAVLSAAVCAAAASQTLTVSDGRKMAKHDRLEVGDEVLYVIQAPKNIDYLNESATLAASATALKAATSSLFTAGCFYKLDSEEIKVSKVSVIGSANIKAIRGVRGTLAVEHDKTAAIMAMRSIFVRRGYDGSTSAYHANASTVYIVDGWSKFEIYENIKRELESIFPLVSKDYLGETVGKVNKQTLDDADATTGWTASADAIAATLNTSDHAEGSGCLNLGVTFSTGVGMYAKTISSGVDVTNYAYLNILVYLENRFDGSDNPYVSEDALEIRFGNDASNYKYYRVGRDSLDEGQFTLLHIPIAEMTTTGTVDITAMDYLAIRINAPQSIAIGDVKMDSWFLTTYPIVTNKLKYRLPPGVREVSEVRILDEEGAVAYTEYNDYRVEGDYLYFMALDTSWFWRPIVLVGQQAFQIPSTTTATVDMPDEVEEVVILGSLIRCYEQKLADILRSDKLSVKYQDGYPLYLDREKRRLVERYQDLRSRLAKPMRARASWFDHG